MVSKEYLIELLKENEVFLEGDFTLSSGKKSNYYINMKKAITDPEILSTISKLITEKYQMMISIKLLALLWVQFR